MRHPAEPPRQALYAEPRPKGPRDRPPRLHQSPRATALGDGSDTTPR
ncbi:hypothetical protein chiPu_0033111, partial [Chiloscyllium punctatum]|nr:hypothetical protein [Chiloscyllium punctatum]